MERYILFVSSFVLCVVFVACSRISEEPYEYEQYEPEVVQIGAPIEIPTPMYEPEQEPCRRVLFIPEHDTTHDFSEDAFEIVEFVEAVHPNFIIDDRMCMENYEAFRDKYLITTAIPMTLTEFVLTTQRFLTVLQDGHISRTFLTGEWVQTGEEWEWVTGMFQDGYFIDHLFLSRNGRLYLADEDYIITGVEVLAIGGVPIDEIFTIIDMYFGAYNYAGRQRVRGRYARYQLILHRAGARLYLCEDQLVVDLTVLKDGKELTMEMGFTQNHPSAYRLPCYQPKYSVRYEMKGDDVLYISLRGRLVGSNSVYRGGLINLCDDYYDANALLSAVEQAMTEDVRKFILDLRNSRGGNIVIGHLLLNSMGATPPRPGHIIRIGDFNREIVEEFFPTPQICYIQHLSRDDFIGREYVYIPRDLNQSDNPYGVFIVVLTSERTFSGATMIATEIADSGFGMIIGEPSATAPTGCGWGQSLFPQNSMLQIRPHFTFFQRPDADADQFTLWPDIHVYEWYALETALEFLNDFSQ